MSTYGNHSKPELVRLQKEVNKAFGLSSEKLNIVKNNNKKIYNILASKSIITKKELVKLILDKSDFVNTDNALDYKSFIKLLDLKDENKQNVRDTIINLMQEVDFLLENNSFNEQEILTIEYFQITLANTLSEYERILELEL